ncbi:MAG: hypothetical protein EOO42_21645 [Flavobacteriales bacterium]|nr:MAG: hypothetical protein EOO42_21645 [Flavobacteriales bacterium]
MSIFQIPHLNLSKEQTGIAQLSMILNSYEQQKIDQLSWPEYQYAPKASFVIGYVDDFLCIKYYVCEHTIAATQNLPNSTVYKDTCVEFFIAFDNSDFYYNLEFNCIGTCQAGYGNAKTDRIDLDPLVIDQITYQSNIKKVNGSKTIQWELTLKIPFAVFSYHHHIEQFKNSRCRVNFYKCGDELPKPHYLSWNIFYNSSYKTSFFYLYSNFEVSSEDSAHNLY